MSEKDTLVVLGASYDSVSDAEVDNYLATVAESVAGAGVQEPIDGQATAAAIANILDNHRQRLLPLRRRLPRPLRKRR